MWSAVFAMATAYAVDCSEPVGHAEFVTALDAAESAYRDMDDDGFRDGVNEIAGLLLPCVGEALPPDLAARYHRLMGLHLLAIGDESGALSAAAAAQAIDPEPPYGTDLLPDSHPLREAWDGGVVDDSMRKVPEPRFGSLSFDGQIGRTRPKNSPTVAQIFDESGLAVSTHYLGPREPLPTYTAVPRQRNSLLACAGAGAALTGLTYGLAWNARSSVFAGASDPSTPPADLDAGRATTNLMSMASGATFAVTLGCGAGALAIGQR